MWFSSRGSRKDLNFQRQFMDNFAKQFDVKNPEDWGKVTNDMIIKNGGSPILINYYGGSIPRALKAIYPGI